jgi:hypothetical protein
MGRPRKGEIRRVTLVCRNCGIQFSKPLSQAARPFHNAACYQAYYRDPERLWERVDRPETTNACWLHRAAPDADGYVHVSFCGRSILAHRLAWELASGSPPPSRMRVCHTCDEPACTRNDGGLGTYELNGRLLPRYGHLFLGTDADNNADKETKGRGDHPAGEQHWRAKLSDEEVTQILTRYINSSLTQREIGRRFGITQGYVSKLIRRENR